MEIKLTDENIKKEIMESDLPALVDFWAPWCAPCNMVTPIVKEIAEHYQGKLKVGKLNVDDAPKTASQYNVMGIPTLMIFKGGKVVEEMVGAAPKEYIEEKIKPHIRKE